MRVFYKRLIKYIIVYSLILLATAESVKVSRKIPSKGCLQKSNPNAITDKNIKIIEKGYEKIKHQWHLANITRGIQRGDLVRTRKKVS